NSGMNMGVSALRRDLRLPVMNVEPLALCALMIFSVSSMSVGMKRRLIDIIIAISCTGTLSTLSGRQMRSIASVRDSGLVVSVSDGVERMSIAMDKVMLMP